MASQVRIAPSILSADFARLGEEVQALEAAGADWIHVDVMDGRFVPNLTIGPPVVKALRAVTALPLDVHLMIVEPERYVDAFADAGADTITLHVEACTHIHRAIQHIHERGKRAGVSLNPSTSEEAVRYLLPSVDLVLVMSVNPGFGGQSFISDIVPKIDVLRKWIAASGRDVDLEVDGGIVPQTAGAACAAGANVLVAGHAIFGGGNYARAIAELRAAAL
jgi:ribulose-phosphate 3-epimerase